MKSTSYLCVLMIAILISIVSPACSTESDGFDQFSLDGTNISMSEISGSWDATRANFSRSAAGPVIEVDIIEIGGDLRLEIANNGRFTVTIEVPNESPEVSNGRLAFDEDALVISFDDDPEEWEYFGIMHQEPNLSIYGGPVYEAYDFDNNGTDEDAEIGFQLLRSNQN